MYSRIRENCLQKLKDVGTCTFKHSKRIDECSIHIYIFFWGGVDKKFILRNQRMLYLCTNLAMKQQNNRPQPKMCYNGELFDQTCLTSPHFVCACPKPGVCNSVVVTICCCISDWFFSGVHCFVYARFLALFKQERYGHDIFN